MKINYFKWNSTVFHWWCWIDQYQWRSEKRKRKIEGFTFILSKLTIQWMIFIAYETVISYTLILCYQNQKMSFWKSENELLIENPTKKELWNPNLKEDFTCELGHENSRIFSPEVRNPDWMCFRYHESASFTAISRLISKANPRILPKLSWAGPAFGLGLGIFHLSLYLTLK